MTFKSKEFFQLWTHFAGLNLILQKPWKQPKSVRTYLVEGSELCGDWEVWLLLGERATGSSKLYLSKYIWKAASKSGFASRTSAITWLTVLLKAFSSRRWMSLSSSVSVPPSLWDSISLDSLEHLTQIFLKHYSYENTTLFQKSAKLKSQFNPQNLTHPTVYEVKSSHQ